MVTRNVLILQKRSLLQQKRQVCRPVGSKIIVFFRISGIFHGDLTVFTTIQNMFRVAQVLL